MAPVIAEAQMQCYIEAAEEGEVKGICLIVQSPIASA